MHSRHGASPLRLPSPVPSLPPLYDPPLYDRRCTLQTCFDLERCQPRAGETEASALRLYIDTPKPATHDMERWPTCMRQTLRAGVTDEAEGRLPRHPCRRLP